MAKKRTIKTALKTKGLLLLVCCCIVVTTTLLLYFHYTRHSTYDDIITRVERSLLDRRLLMRGAEEPKSRIAILAIDDKAINIFGRWPFSRHHYKTALANLKNLGVQWIGFDAVFSEAEHASLNDAKDILNQSTDLKPSLERLNAMMTLSPADQLFAEGISNFKNIVLGYFYFLGQNEVKAAMREKDAFHGLSDMESSAIQAVIFPEEKSAQNYPFMDTKGIVSNIEAISKASQFHGFFSNELDEDAITRWVTLVRTVDGKVMPSLSLKLAAEIMQRDILVEFNQRGIEALELISRKDESDIVHVPIDPLGRGRALLNHRGPAKTFRHFSLADAFNNSFTEEEKVWLKDSSLLLGMTAIGVNDIRPNPFDSTIDGVEVQATAVDNILNQDFLVRPKSIFGFEILLAILIGLIFSPLVIFVRPTYSGILTLIFLVGYFYFDRYFWFAKRQWIYMGVYCIEIGLLYMVTTVIRYITEEYEKRKIQGAFGLYLAPKVIERLMDDPEALKLGGERRELSVFFSDVRGFTTISESLNPEQLCEFMNEYFTPMTAIILRTGGVLDKYIGDAIMAFWGAPIPLPDQADRTVKAAIEMLFALEKVQHDFKAKSFPFVDMGMGVNTGEMSVGNMGSHERFCYTVMGDSVNLGSRLESLTKEYGIRLMISEFTVARLQNKKDYALRDLDDIRVKGKKEPVKVFNVLKPGEIAEKNVKEFLELFEQGRLYYRQQNWEKATKCFTSCIMIEAKDGPSLLYLKRIEEFKLESPGVDWDGVYTFTHK